MTQPTTKRLVTEAVLAATSTGDRNRGNHTGTQASATISDWAEAVQDVLGASIAAGTGVSVTYDDAGGQVIVAATGAGGSTDPEVVRDTVAAALVAGAGISVTVNDAGDTITIANTGNTAGAALKTETAGYRRRTDANEAAPTAANWPARPSGYLFVVSIGADPSPNDQQAGDQRQIPQ